MEQIIAQIREALASGDHPGDLLALLEDQSLEDRIAIIENLPQMEALLIFQEMENFEQAAILPQLTDQRTKVMLSEMASDDAADMIGELASEESDQVMSLIAQEDKLDFDELLKYPDDSAGGIMATEYISLPADIPVEEAIARLREVAPEAETIYYIYIVDHEGRLIGVLVPMLGTMVNIDPAITAGPFVPTIKDVVGLLLYFAIASAFLEHLI